MNSLEEVGVGDSSIWVFEPSASADCSSESSFLPIKLPSVVLAPSKVFINRARSFFSRIVRTAADPFLAITAMSEVGSLNGSTTETILEEAEPVCFPGFVIIAPRDAIVPVGCINSGKAS